jgi:hypothetical protein
LHLFGGLCCRPSWSAIAFQIHQQAQLPLPFCLWRAMFCYGNFCHAVLMPMFCPWRFLGGFVHVYPACHCYLACAFSCCHASLPSLLVPLGVLLGHVEFLLPHLLFSLSTYLECSTDASSVPSIPYY